MNLTFITNTNSLFDGSHKMSYWIGKKLHQRKQKDSHYQTKYEDTEEFDLGYNQSYTLAIFLNCLLFANIVPLIPLFACFYFYIKYNVDKSNLIFVYFKKYESGGQIRNTVKNIMIFDLYFYMVVMVSFFSIKFSDHHYGLIGIVIVVGWTALAVYFKDSFEPFANFR